MISPVGRMGRDSVVMELRSLRTGRQFWKDWRTVHVLDRAIQDDVHNGLVSCQSGFNRTTLLSALRLQEVRVVKVPCSYKGGDDAVEELIWFRIAVLLLGEV